MKKMLIAFLASFAFQLASLQPALALRPGDFVFIPQEGGAFQIGVIDSISKDANNQLGVRVRKVEDILQKSDSPTGFSIDASKTSGEVSLAELLAMNPFGSLQDCMRMDNDKKAKAVLRFGTDWVESFSNKLDRKRAKNLLTVWKSSLNSYLQITHPANPFSAFAAIEAVLNVTKTQLPKNLRQEFVEEMANLEKNITTVIVPLPSERQSESQEDSQAYQDLMRKQMKKIQTMADQLRQNQNQSRFRRKISHRQTSFDDTDASDSENQDRNYSSGNPSERQ